MTFPVLQDKVAIITGAAMGMGEATAKLFAEAGAKVVVADYNADLGQKVTYEINESGGTAHFVKVDISKSEQVKAMIDETVKVFGRRVVRDRDRAPRGRRVRHRSLMVLR